MSPEVILVTVDIKANTERLVELRKELNENADKLKALAVANKEGRLSGDELAAGQVRLGQSSKQAQGEIALLTKANAQQTVANKAAAGSTEQLRAQYGLAVAALNKLTTEERDNTVAGQKLAATTKAMSDELKRQEAAYGSTSRSVGDYNKGVKDVNVVSGQLTGGLQAAVEKGLSPFKNELERGSGLLGKFKSGSDLVKQGLGLLKGAGEEGALGFKAIAGGIALTGIGLFVIAISAVVAYFTQTAEGGRQLASVLGGLGGVLQVATDLITDFGKTIVKAFTSPIKSIESFAKTMRDALFHPIDFANRLSKSMGDVADRVKGAYTASAEFANRARELLIARRDLDKQDAIEESRVNVLLRLSKERGKSAGEQLTALKEAGTIEAKITTDSIALKQKELNLINDRITNAGKGKTAELKADKAAKELEIIQASTQQDETNARIKVRESVFVQQQRTAAAAAALTQRQDAVKNRQTQVEQELLVVAKGTAAELVLLQRKIDLLAALELTDLKKSAAARKLILSTAEAEKKALQDAFNQKAIEDAKKHTAETAAEANRQYIEAQKALEDFLNTKRALVERDYALGKTSENEYQKQLNAIDVAGDAAALVNARAFAKEEGAITKKTEDDKLKGLKLTKEGKKAIKDAEQSILQAGLAAEQAASDAVIGLFGAESDAGRVALGIKKTLALAEIAINLQKQLSLNATAGRALDLLLPGSGIAYEIATDTLAIAGALAAATKIAGFKQGGYVSGAGTGTSDSIPARLSNGESVMNANTTAMYGGLLSHLNVLGGGVAFASGGLVPGSAPRATSINDGGLIARQLGGAAAGIDYKALAQAMTQVTVEANFVAFDKSRARYDNARAHSTLG